MADFTRRNDLLNQNLASTSDTNGGVNDPYLRQRSGNWRNLGGTGGGGSSPSGPGPVSDTGGGGNGPSTGSMNPGAGTPSGAGGGAPAGMPGVQPGSQYTPFSPSYEPNVTVSDPFGGQQNMNSGQFATQGTANDAAGILGGKSVDMNLGGGFQNSAPQRQINVNGVPGDPSTQHQLNAGLVADQFAKYGSQPGSLAWNTLNRDMGNYASLADVPPVAKMIAQGGYGSPIYAGGQLINSNLRP